MHDKSAHKLSHCIISDTFYLHDFHSYSMPFQGLHDNMSWKCFPHYWPFVMGMHQSPVDSLKNSQYCRVWCCLCCQPEQAVEQFFKLPVIWDPTALMWSYCYEFAKHNYFNSSIWGLYSAHFRLIYYSPLAIVSWESSNDTKCRIC